MKPLKPISFVFPLKGYNVNWGADNQPKDTSPSLRNVLPYDSGNRARGGQRRGVSKLITTQFGGGAAVTQLYQATLGLNPGATDVDVPFSDNLSDKVNDYLANYPAQWLAQTTQTGSTVYGTVSLSSVVSAFVGDNDAANATKDFLVTDEGSGVLALNNLFQGSGAAIAQAWTSAPTKHAVTADLLSSDVWKSGVFLRGQFGGLGAGTVMFYIDHANTTCKLSYITQTGFSAPVENVVASHTFSVSAGTYTTLKLAVDGNDFTGYVDGVSVVTGTIAVIDPLQIYPGVFHTKRTSLTGYGNFAKNVLVTSDLVVGKDAIGFRSTKLVVASNGAIYSGPVTGPTLATGGTGVYTVGYKPNMTDLDGKVYVVDGTASAAPKVLDLSTNAVTTLAAASGKGTVPTGCRIAVTYFGALVLASNPGGEQNIYMSRVGDPTDWLFGQTDELSATDLNASTAGHIGQIVLALCPFRDDVMLIGCDHSIFALTGHPAAGGRIDTVSDSIGMYGQDAWAIGADGSIYFLGTGGFYRYTPGTQPVNLSKDKLGRTFVDLNRKRNYVEVEYDRDNHGCWIFITPSDPTAIAPAIWYDERLDAFFPCDFPISHGPVSALVFDGDASKDRYLILGGRDGILRRYDNTRDDDDGDAINSAAYLGPFFPVGPGLDVKLESLEPTLATTTTNCDYFVLSGDDAQTALTNDPAYSGNWSRGGRLQPIRKRARGCCFFLVLSNSTARKTWGWEGAQGTITPGGKLRKLR